MGFSGKNMNENAARLTTISIGVVVNHFGSILLVRPDDETEWQFPRLHQGWCETMPDAIERAVYEQSAIRVEAGGIIQAYDLISEEADSHVIMIDFDAAYLGGDLSCGSQVIDVAWASGLALRTMAVEENTLELLTDMGFMS